MEMMQPFSNGSSAYSWYDNNCCRCVKAFFPKEDGDYPSDKTMKNYCSIGKECKLKYAIDHGFITGEIPLNIAKQIGLNRYGQLKDSCMLFSDDEDDGYKPKRPTKPDNTPGNQLVMFSEFDSLFSKKEELVNG